MRRRRSPFPSAPGFLVVGIWAHVGPADGIFLPCLFVTRELMREMSATRSVTDTDRSIPLRERERGQPTPHVQPAPRLSRLRSTDRVVTLERSYVTARAVTRVERPVPWWAAGFVYHFCPDPINKTLNSKQ